MLQFACLQLYIPTKQYKMIPNSNDVIGKKKLAYQQIINLVPSFGTHPQMEL